MASVMSTPTESPVGLLRFVLDVKILFGVNLLWNVASAFYSSGI
jgi:hypothetical protein